MIRTVNKNTIAASKELIQKKKINKIEQIFSIIPNLFSTKQTIAVLRLDGIIGKASPYKTGLTASCLNPLIEKAFNIKGLCAVMLSINSPGGSPVQSELISARIRQLSYEKSIPVYSFVEDVAASGGYWLATSGEQIFASRSSLIGSIGVISSGFGFQDAISKLGIERRVYTAGKSKSVLDPFQNAKKSDIDIIKKIQANIHDHFIEHVKLRRKAKLTQSDDVLFNGEFWSGEIALDYGLIDGIENMYDFIRGEYGSDVKIEYIENKQSWFKKKFLGASLHNNFADELSDALLDKAENKLMQNKYNFE